VRVLSFVASVGVDNPSYRRPVCDRVLYPGITILIHCHSTISSFLVLSCLHVKIVFFQCGCFFAVILC
jgi:hypothetical protein